MKSSQFADAGPRIKSASRWRSCALFLSGLTLFLGLAATAYAKKPVKPPPEPPPEAEGGTIYFRLNEEWGINPAWVCQMNPDGTNVIQLFEMANAVHEYDIVIPSKQVYGSGRLFVCSKLNPYTIEVEWEDENGEIIVETYPADFYTSLILVDESGNMLGDLIPEDTLEVLGVVWYADDSKLAVLACGIEEDGSFPNIKLNEQTMGIYLVDIAVDSNGVPMVSPPALLEWTTEVALAPDDPYYAFPETCIDSFDVLTIETGSDLIYFSRWVDTDPQDCDLYEAGLESGEAVALSTRDYTSLRLHPDGGVLIGDDGSTTMVKYYLETDEEVTLLPPKTNLRRWGGAVWSPSGDNISFGQLSKNFFPKIMRATADAEDVTELFGSTGSGRCAGPFGWRASP